MNYIPQMDIEELCEHLQKENTRYFEEVRDLKSRLERAEADNKTRQTKLAKTEKALGVAMECMRCCDGYHWRVSEAIKFAENKIKEILEKL